MAKREKRKLDDFLLSEGLAPDLREARALIMAGQVLVDEQRVDKPGTLVDTRAFIRLRGQRRFVSRGGDKLWGAIEDLGVAALFQDAVVLDCGSSTGGFTDCALHLGARRVYAIEMGFHQLAWKLRSDPRVVVMEQTDLRTIDRVLDPEASIVLADISFSSLARILPAICALIPARPVQVHFLLLVKPQFELESDRVPAGGVVDDQASRSDALSQAEAAAQQQDLILEALIPSRLLGREGNQEFFLYATRKG